MPAHASTRPSPSPLSRSQVNTQTHVIDTSHGRILCIADIRGRLSALNDLAREVNAKAIIHTGDFGFFEANSLDRINDRTLRHLTMYSPLIASAQRTHLLAAENPPSVIRSTVNIALLSEFPLLVAGQIKFQVPVYTVWGACEDVLVLEKFRLGNYSIDNLHVLDEATTRCLDLGGVKLRLLGLGGALVPHKMFDNGDGNSTIAGGQGTMWTTALQIGELVDTAQRVYDQTETRLLVTHTSPGREGIMAQLALVLKADLTISAGLHFRYATSYNEFSVQGDFEGFRHKLSIGKEGFDKVWESVKSQVDAVIDENQKILLDKAFSVMRRSSTSAPANTGEEPAWKNCWNWNLTDAAYGSLVLDIKEGRISSELKSQGFNYAYRRSGTVAPTPSTPSSALPPTQTPIIGHSTSLATPIPEKSLPPHMTYTSGKASPQTFGSFGNPSSRTETPLPGTVKPNGATEKEKPKKDKKEKKSSREDTGTPDPSKRSSTPDISTSTIAELNKGDADDSKSPTDGSSGVRTPRTGKPPRNPWTIFMRMQPQLQVTDAEIKDFFGEAKDSITRINCPPPYAGKAKFAYVEFGDEESMKMGLQMHAEKLKDTVPEVKQASDRESRGEPFRGFSARGRGRGGGGGFASRGLSAAGLTRGQAHRGNGEAGHAPKGDSSKSGGGGA